MENDDGDRLITSVGGCHLRSEDGEEPIPIWDPSILSLPQMRQELKRIIEDKILDMSFEEELVQELGEAYYIANEKALESDNENLRNLARILMKLAESMDQVIKDREKKGGPPFVDFEFYIPRY